MPELIRHGENGFLVGSLEEAVDAVGAVARLDRAAVRASVVERFDRMRMVDEYIEVYEQVVRRHRIARAH